MSKKEAYKEHLTKLVLEVLKTSNSKYLLNYLASNSNLPGPRGNLELADAFADAIEAYSRTDSEKLWDLCLELTRYSAEEAPTDSPAEFFVFCGARGMGVFGTSSAHSSEAQSALMALAGDSRWRTREGVAMAIQNMIRNDPRKTLEMLGKWIGSDDWLVMRAVAAGVAEPPLLKDREMAKSALELHKVIFEKILTAKDREASFKTLRQGLGYSLSVIVHAAPVDGFGFMRQLAETCDGDILWIVKENLKKSRLTKNFPGEVESLRKLTG